MTNTPTAPSIVEDAHYLKTQYPRDYREVSSMYLISLRREALRIAR